MFQLLLFLLLLETVQIEYMFVQEKVIILWKQLHSDFLRVLVTALKLSKLVSYWFLPLLKSSRLCLPRSWLHPLLAEAPPGPLMQFWMDTDAQTQYGSHQLIRINRTKKTYWDLGQFAWSKKGRDDSLHDKFKQVLEFQDCLG